MDQQFYDDICSYSTFNFIIFFWGYQGNPIAYYILLKYTNNDQELSNNNNFWLQDQFTCGCFTIKCGYGPKC
jgi:hypothetical protein